MQRGSLDLGAIDLNLVHALDVLLQERNVTRAAVRLRLTQSATSHRLKRLRALLGDSLLVPGRGGLVPTPRALELAGAVRRTMQDLAATLAHGEPFDPATSERSFVVVTSDFAEIDALPRVLELLSRQAPGVALTVREPGPGLLEALERGEVDIVMGPSLPPHAGLVQRRVGDDGFAGCVRRDHPIVRRKLDVAAYAALPHLVISPTASASVSPVDTALAARGLARRVCLRVPHFLGAPFLTARSDLVLTAPRSMLVHAARLLPLHLFDPPLPLPRVPVVMTWHERATSDPGHVWLRELAGRCTAAALGRPRDYPAAAASRAGRGSKSGARRA